MKISRIAFNLPKSPRKILITLNKNSLIKYYITFIIFYVKISYEVKFIIFIIKNNNIHNVLISSSKNVSRFWHETLNQFSTMRNRFDVCMTMKNCILIFKIYKNNIYYLFKIE